MTTTTTSTPSTLASLRALIPRCHLDFDDTKAVAERQATRMIELLGAQTDGIAERDLAKLPRLQIVREVLPTSGLSYWNGHTWIIVLNAADSPARQRFTLLHEFKHIIDHGANTRLYKSGWEAERAADYFAGCALMPKRDLKRVFCNVTQRVDRLARHFGVSQQAVRVRLEQTGLLDRPVFTRERCARPISTPHWQDQKFRSVVTNPRSYA